MTNYNERLDEILAKHGAEEGEFTESLKRAITSLIKELVAEAKPEEYEDYYSTDPVEKGRKIGYDESVREFEQNLLKALEEM